MNILIVNDDGVYEEGIIGLGRELAKADGMNVYICAPATQQSGKSHSISFLAPLKLQEIQPPAEGIKRCFSCFGTPADCTRIGIMKMRDEGVEIGLVISGINAGVNLGTDVHYSGTVGGAKEACLCGKKAIAVSTGSERTLNTHMNVKCASKIVLKIIEDHWDELNETWFPNINVPNVEEEDIKGIVYTHIGWREYMDISRPLDEFRGDDGYTFKWLTEKCKQTNRAIDVVANQSEYISITPIKIDVTDYEMLQKISTWKLK